MTDRWDCVNELVALLSLAEATGYKRFDSLFCLAELVRTRRPKAVLELGACFGASTCFMARELADDASLTTVDDFALMLPTGEATEARLAESLSRFRVQHRVRVVRGDTRIAGELVTGPFDFAFFDASHNDVGLLLEFRSVLPRLASGALVVVDDAKMAPEAVWSILRDRRCAFLEVHHGLAIAEIR